MALVVEQDVVARGRSELNAHGDAAREYRVQVGATVHHANRHDLRAKILSALDDLGMRVIVLDASATGFLDTSALAMLVGASRRVREQGGSLTIVGLNEEMRELCRITQLDTLLEIAP